MPSLDAVILDLRSIDSRKKLVTAAVDTTLTLTGADVAATRATDTPRFIVSCELRAKDRLGTGDRDEVLFDFGNKFITRSMVAGDLANRGMAFPLTFEDRVGWTALDEDAPGPFGSDEVYARITVRDTETADEISLDSQPRFGRDWGDRTG